MFEKVISGGQTGVDRAALDVALELGVLAGGWCPKGRKAEDGSLAPRYPLTETPSEEYWQRTEWNVRDSDGTAYTIEVAKKLGKPYLVLDLSEAPNESAVKDWVDEHEVRVLNVAGPRESKCPGIYAQAAQFLRAI